MAVLFLEYFALAALVVFLSVKLADYVDLIDKKTDISGAFIGGVILAAVTSLPELFTSVTSVTLVDSPELVIGNILGSNIFNMTILGVIIFFCTRSFAKSTVGKSHLKTIAFTALMFVAMYFAVNLELDYDFFGISFYSVIIIIAYVISVKLMAGDSAENDSGECNSKLTIKQIVIRFIIVAILLVLVSILITQVTDKLSAELNLGATLAGAVFLGVATSLPELTSCIALAKKKNFNACVGNVLGSGMFNFCIMAVADIIYRKGSVYITSRQSELLVMCCLISSALVILLLSFKNSDTDGKKSLLYRILSIGITAAYVMFLVMS